MDIFKLPENYQEMVWGGALSVTHIQELEPMFTKVDEGVMSITEVIKLLDQVITQKPQRSHNLHITAINIVARTDSKAVRTANNLTRIDASKKIAGLGIPCGIYAFMRCFSTILN